MANQNKLKEALNLLNSAASDTLVNELEFTITEALEKTKGDQLVKIESAVELTLDEKKRLEEILSKNFKLNMRKYYEVRPNLLGGFKITVGDWRLDATIVNQLNHLKSAVGGKS